MPDTIHSVIGNQTPPPLRRAFRIAVQGIRIRIGRSLVTLSGVALGIAFLMSTITTQFIDRTVNSEREFRQQLSMMESVLKSQIGRIDGKTIAVAVFGNLSPLESALLQSLRNSAPAVIRLYGMPALDGFTSAAPPELGKDADALVLLGNATSCSIPLSTLTAGMVSPLVIDSLAGRQCQDEPAVRRELFFGHQEVDRERQASRASGDRFRLIWIVVISLAVTVIGVANALLMSVTERFREIGTMKCLGALSSFIRRLFLIESFLIGLSGSIIGVVAGFALTMAVYGAIYTYPLVFGAISGGLLAAALASIAAGTLLAVAAALYPARFASRMIPATALRSNV